MGMGKVNLKPVPRVGESVVVYEGIHNAKSVRVIEIITNITGFDQENDRWLVFVSTQQDERENVLRGTPIAGIFVRWSKLGGSGVENAWIPCADKLA